MKNNTKRAVMLATCLGLFISTQAMAAGDAAAGKAKSAVCAACHMADGNSVSPIYPKLAGQHAPYLEAAIKAYRDGKRQGGNSTMMAPMAKGLSDADIANLAAYFSQQKPK